MKFQTGLRSRVPSTKRVRGLAFIPGTMAGGALLSLALLSVPLSAQSGNALAILERASSRMQAMAAFCTDFRQEVRVTILRQTTRSSGVLCQARPDRFDMRFSDPEGDRVVADGTHLWVYFPSTDAGQVFRTRMSVSEGRFDLHHEFLADPGERYDATWIGEESIHGRLADVLTLEPRVASPYRRAKVWIDRGDSTIRRIEIEEESESIRLVDLSEYRVNPPLAADYFRFNPGPGVQVITR